MNVARPAAPLRWPGQRVVVTGGAGFIGSHLVEALLASGAHVVVLDNLSTGQRGHLQPGPVGEVGSAAPEVLVGDIRDRAICDQACAGSTVVFHLAAQASVALSMTDPATAIDINVTGSAQVFAAASRAGVRRLVYASSSAVYGDQTALPSREGNEGAALSPYAASKAMVEDLARVTPAFAPLELVGMRFFNVFGPRQDPRGGYAAVIPALFASWLSGQAPNIYGDGEQSRDFLYVTDAVKAMLAAALAPASVNGRAFNVGRGVGVTINHLATLIGRQLGAATPPVHQPPRAGEVRHSWADMTATRQELGFSPTVELESGLARCVEFYRQDLNRPA